MEKDGDAIIHTQDSKVAASQKSSATSQRRQEDRGTGKEYGYVEKQNFLILSILLASVCGCFNVLTLICSAPAVLSSIRVRPTL